MELVVARTHKERVALKYGETFLNLIGLKLEDVVEMRKTLEENQTLIAANKKLLAENKRLKGETNEQADESGENSGKDISLTKYLTEQEGVK